MVASAPFDNWWHNAYGLDVRIISPPHTILALGIGAICVGALLLSLAWQNRESEHQRTAMWLFVVAGSLLLMDRAIMLTEYSGKNQMHTGLFYRASLLAYPMAIAMMARASKLKWAGTITSAIFMAIMLALMWIIQLFPATPKLGPIYQPITHMVAMAFPVLLVIPALGIDIVMQRVRARPLILAPMLSLVFLALFLAVQWPFASFLMTSPARNWFFNADNFVYWLSPSGVDWSRNWMPAAPGEASFGAQIAVAFVLGTISSYVGLWFGTWMTKVRR
jgi:hypothetical protein